MGEPGLHPLRRGCRGTVRGLRIADWSGAEPPNGRFTFGSGVRAQLPGLDSPLDAIDGEGGHIQGFARIPGLGDEDWLVMSRSNERGRPAGLLYVRLEDVPERDGDRLVASPEDRDFFWHDTPQPAPCTRA